MVSIPTAHMSNEMQIACRDHSLHEMIVVLEMLVQALEIHLKQNGYNREE